MLVCITQMHCAEERPSLDAHSTDKGVNTTTHRCALSQLVGTLLKRMCTLAYKSCRCVHRVISYTTSLPSPPAKCMGGWRHHALSAYHLVSLHS
jgi:hypothetical protein